MRISALTIHDFKGLRDVSIDTDRAGAVVIRDGGVA